MNAEDQLNADQVTAALADQLAHEATEPEQRSLWKRTLARLFPARRLPAPADGCYLRTYMVTRFDWIDRLRVLVSGHVMTELLIETDVQVTKATSDAVQYVLPPGGEG